MGVILVTGAYGKVGKAVQLRIKKEYAIKILDLEVELSKTIADKEKVNLERLKGFSPYLLNLVDCFDEV
jgi:nucleoside-diphosphate-sugar epimerase